MCPYSGMLLSSGFSWDPFPFDVGPRFTAYPPVIIRFWIKGVLFMGVGFCDHWRLSAIEILAGII